MVQVLAISPLQEPFDLGQQDEAGRALYVFNVLSLKRPSSTFLRELIGVLTAAGVGTEGVDLFAGSLATVPAGDGPFLFLRATSGAGPLGTHNEGAAAYRRPGAMLTARASTLEAAEGMALAAYAALVAVRNQALEA